MHSDDIVPEGFRWFLEKFPRARDLYVDIINVVESSGQLFTEPASVPLFVRDDAFTAGTPRLSFKNISLDGAYLSPDVVHTLDTSHVKSLSLYNQIIRDPDYMPVLRLLELMPELEVLRCHLHWQFPDRQRLFWASVPDAVLAARVQHLGVLDLIGFKNDVVDFYNDVSATPHFKPRDVSLGLLCDCSDAFLPTFDEVEAFNDEVEHFADELEVDFRLRSICSSRDSGNGYRITYHVRWELTNTSIGYWVRQPSLFCIHLSFSDRLSVRVPVEPTWSTRGSLNTSTPTFKFVFHGP